MSMTYDAVRNQLDSGMQLLYSKRFDQAAQIFEQALNEPGGYEYYIRNNLATALIYQGKFAEAKAALEPNLVIRKSMSPYFLGLMSLIQSASGNCSKAQSLFKQGIQRYEVDVVRGEFAGSESEYALMLMRAGVVAQSHKQVCEFYRSHSKKYDSGEIHRLAGISAFNLKRFPQAAAYWACMALDCETTHPAVLVAQQAAVGEIPHFLISYTELDAVHLTHPLDEMLEAADRVEPFTGDIILSLLELLLMKGTTDNQLSQIARMLILQTGSWGLEFGKRLLQTDMVGLPVKYQALDALIDGGVYTLNERVKILQDGKPMEIMTQYLELAPDDLESMAILSEANALLKEDKAEESLRFILTKGMYNGRSTPETVLKLAEIHLKLGNEKEVLRYLEILRDQCLNAPELGFDPDYAFENAPGMLEALWKMVINAE